MYLQKQHLCLCESFIFFLNLVAEWNRSICILENNAVVNRYLQRSFSSKRFKQIIQRHLVLRIIAHSFYTSFDSVPFCHLFRVQLRFINKVVVVPIHDLAVCHSFGSSTCWWWRTSVSGFQTSSSSSFFVRTSCDLHSPSVYSHCWREC